VRRMLALFFAMALASPALAQTPPAPAPATAPPPDCGYDRGSMLQQSYIDFEERPGGGWHAIGRIPGCEAVAADLIHDFLVANAPLVNEYHTQVLKWREGLLRARAGQTGRAMILLASGRSQTDVEQALYTDLTIAFLRHNTAAFTAAVEQYRTLTPPRSLGAEAELLRSTSGAALAWPPHGQEVDNLARCPDAPYPVAITGVCPATTP
jgi:hypothetical protein